MQLGAFSISLVVKDIAASRAFYEKLGFTQVGGAQAQGWLVLGNGSAKVGLFQGHIQKNTLTFNPGWSSSKETLADFTDVRELQKTFRERGLKLDLETDDAATGPGFIVLTDLFAIFFIL